MLWYINYTINTYTRQIYICYYKGSLNLTDVNNYVTTICKQ